MAGIARTVNTGVPPLNEPAGENVNSTLNASLRKSSETSELTDLSSVRGTLTDWFGGSSDKVK